MPDDASAAEEPAALAGRVRSALESGDLDAIRDLLDPGVRWGAPMAKSGASSPGRPLTLTAARSRLATGRRDRCPSLGLAVVTGRDPKVIREPPRAIDD